MEEVKKKTTKKVNIKNIKVAKESLNKSSIKGKTAPKKTNNKPIVKKKNPNNNKKTSLKAKNVSDEIIEKKTKSIKTPNNIKRKTTVKIKKAKVEQDKKKTSKKKEEEKSFTTKYIFPKEWKSINSKNNKNKKIENDNPKTIKGKIRKSLFESIDEKELEERKAKEKEGLKKALIIFLIVFASLGLLLLILVKYNDFVRKQLAVYQSYKIGDAVYLKDNSKWFVVKDTSSREEYIKLLSNKIVDINDDGVVDSNDAIAYNTENKAEYDTSNEKSAAYVLNDSLKKKYEKEIGSIHEINLLTAEEYVKIRERMEFGDEWSNDNWLAGKENQKWWVMSRKNGKVYVVSFKGTFYLSNAKNSHFVRPTITIKKELISKTDETKEIKNDLINGL